MLANILKRWASSNPVGKSILGMKGKVRTRKSVADMQRLQGFLEESARSGSIKEKIVREGSMDQEFGDFLRQFREKNKDYGNILDMSRFYDENNRLKNDEKLREDEIEMLKEFQKRAHERRSAEKEMLDERGHHRTRGPFLNNRNNAFHPLHHMKGEKFMYIILNRGVTTKVTKLQRVNRFRYLIFAGNSNGVIGYGKGKGVDWETSLQKAFNDLKSNLVSLDIHESNTFPLQIQTKFVRQKVNMEPVTSFNCWGNPIYATMIQLAGIHNVRFNLTSRNENVYNLMYSFMKVSCMNRSIPTLAEVHGVKPFQLGLSKGHNQMTNVFKAFVSPK